MITRWDEWFSKENLSKDKRILKAPASLSAGYAATVFMKRGKKRILDLACGVGRDTWHLDMLGLTVTGVDASLNGLMVASHAKKKHGAMAQFVNADALYLPFSNGCFEGIYCFGLLHEFTRPEKAKQVKQVITEVRRILHEEGLFALTVAAGDPQAGLPHVQLFDRSMFEQAMEGWHALEIRAFDDTGCTCQTDYHIWYGLFEK